MSREAGTRGGSSNCGTASEECEGEDEESSSLNLEALSLEEPENNNEKERYGLNNSVELELSNFRQQWQRELESPSKLNVNQNATQSNSSNAQKTSEDNLKSQQKVETEEEKAKRLFLKGVEHERNGELYEAIKFYKRAVQLVPDIELRIYENTKLKNAEDSPNKINEKQSVKSNENLNKKYKEVDHLAKIQKIVLKNGCICTPEFDQKVIVDTTHISSLPNELIMYILRWVVSSDLDMVSLERFASVCRGFYVCARDTEIWRLACIKTWGINCCTFGNLGYLSWRNMFLERPRLKYNGCYISTTTYVRPGENSFQDQFYRPWHMVKYFRYLRFFPDGVVLTMITADEPIMCLDRLKHRHSRSQEVLRGHYRLNGDKVDIFVGKSTNQSKVLQSSNSRLKSKAKDMAIENTYHMELQVKSYQSRKFCSLVWQAYSVYSVNLSNGNAAATSFEIVKSKFPSFKFSQVNRYHAKTDDPLE